MLAEVFSSGACEADVSRYNVISTSLIYAWRGKSALERLAVRQELSASLIVELSSP